MHNLIQALQKITERMVEQLDSATEEQLVLFVDQRDALIQQLQKKDITESDRKRYGDIVRRILLYDPVIKARLDQHKLEAREGFRKANLAKIQNTAYNMSYTPDSYYFDKKK